MFAKINHLAMLSDQYPMVSNFYQAVFGMKTSGNPRPARASVVGDGYIGFNINPRSASRRSGLDHFGFMVEDLETVYERMRKKSSECQWVKRPSARPFAGVSGNDPDGNVFDLSQQNVEHRKDVYVDGAWEQDRTVHHFAIRTMHPEKCAEFYADVFELSPANVKNGEGNHYLTDGRVTMIIKPWSIEGYLGTGITGAGMDHIGFKVESVDALKKDIEVLVSNNPKLAPVQMGGGPEGIATMKMFTSTCPFGQHHFADVDGVMLDVFED